MRYLVETHQPGDQHFNGKKSHSFTVLNRQESNNRFYKHIDYY
ncbi:hypothetical protein [Pedobacter sp. SYSU D00535]|nr:hypothetical protein [Pedobacter sp. SYSU D00535]